MIFNKMENMPSHVAIIPDGNRRWAKEKGLAPWRGHIKGAEITKEILKAALEAKICCFSMWGGSWNNLTKRPKTEVKVLLRIYEQYFKKIIKRKELYENKVKVNIIGRWPELIGESGVKAARDLIEATKDHHQHLLNFLIGYNGTDEMLSAVKGIVKEAKASPNLKASESLLKKHLWTGFLPPVDLLIRTGSGKDPHNSVGFMMWQTANSQLYFTKTQYPDFSKEKFLEAIGECQRRERRHGK